MKLLKGVMVVGLVFAVTITAKGDLIAKLPATTKVVAKLDLERLRNSQFYANIEQQNLEKIEEAQDKIANQIGIDPKSVSTIWLAGVKKKEGMIILNGKFDAAAIKEAVSAKPECQIIDRNDCELAVYCPQKNKSGKNLAVLIDANTLAIGEPAFVDSFISSFKGKGAALSEETVTKANAALGKNILFQGVLLSTPENPNPQNQLASAVLGGNACLDVTDKITCSADITMKNDESAKAATQIIFGMLAVYEMNQPDNVKGELVKESILSNLNVKQNGNAINISGGIDAKTLEQLIEKIN